MASDGGPAFPCRKTERVPMRGSENFTVTDVSYPGMSLRAYLIAHAPDPTQGMMVCARKLEAYRLERSAQAIMRNDEQLDVELRTKWADGVIAEVEKDRG